MIEKKTVFLILMLICIGSYVYFFELGVKSGENVEQVEKLFYLEIGQISEIMIKYESKRFRIKNDHGKWQVEKSGSLVEEEKITELISVFRYGIVRLIEENPEDMSRFGLEDPEIEIDFKVRGTDSTPGCRKVLYIGKANPTHTSCYAMVGEANKVLLLGIGVKDEIKRFFRDIERVAGPVAGAPFSLYNLPNPS